MFERFTEQARQVVVEGQHEAARLRHDYIGTEHLLLGLQREGDGVAARALHGVGVILGAAREQIESIVGYGEGHPRPAPFTARSKRVLRLVKRGARQLDDHHVRGEHILLGLTREGEDVAVRREVVERLAVGEAERNPSDEAEAGARVRRFRGRVIGVRAGLDLPRPQSVSVDADHTYRASVGVRDSSRPLKSGFVAGLLQDESAGTEAKGIGAVEATIGERLLDAFPAMLEATVSGLPEPADAQRFSVSATFRR